MPEKILHGSVLWHPSVLMYNVDMKRLLVRYCMACVILLMYSISTARLPIGKMS